MYAMTIIRMLRLRVLAVIILISVIAMLLLGRMPEQNLAQLATISFLLALWYLNGAVINDIADVKIDKINLKNAAGRPLANQRTSRTYMIILAVISALLAVVVAVSVNQTAGLIISIGCILNYLYSMPPVRFSYRGVWALLLLPIGYVVIPFTLAYAFFGSTIDFTAFLLLVSLYISFVGRLALKDYRDVVGDKKYGKKTFLLRYGSAATVLFSKVAFVLGGILAIHVFGKQYLPLCFVIAAHLVLIWYVLDLIKLSSFGHAQQVYVGSVARVATTTLICIALYLQSSLGGLFDQQHMNTLLILGVAVYGAADSLYAALNPKTIRVRY